MKNYIKKHFVNTRLLLKGFIDKGGVDELHDLRVELKKVRAIAKFIKLHHPGKKFKKINTPLKEFFSLCGELRDAQVIEKHFLNNNLHSIYKDLKTTAALEKTEQQLRKKADKFIKILDKTEKEFLDTDAVNNEELITDYIKNINLTLEERISITPPRQYWHDIRKQMKQCMYAEGWINKEIIAASTLKKYDTMQDLIGTWHDETLYGLFLDSVKRNYKGNAVFIAALKAPIKNNKEAAKLKENEIKQHLKDLLPHADGVKKPTFTEVLP